MPQAYRGSQQVNPLFTNPSEVSARIASFLSMGSRTSTFGIATATVAGQAGAAWAASSAAGRTRVYLAPQDKGSPRGYQANFQERDGANALVVNLHLSISQL